MHCTPPPTPHPPHIPGLFDWSPASGVATYWYNNTARMCGRNASANNNMITKTHTRSLARSPASHRMSVMRVHKHTHTQTCIYGISIEYVLYVVRLRQATSNLPTNSHTQPTTTPFDVQTHTHTHADLVHWSTHMRTAPAHSQTTYSEPNIVGMWPQIMRLECSISSVRIPL